MADERDSLDCPKCDEPGSLQWVEDEEMYRCQACGSFIERLVGTAAEIADLRRRVRALERRLAEVDHLLEYEVDYIHD